MSMQIHCTVEVWDTQTDKAVVRSGSTKTIVPANSTEDVSDVYILLQEGVKTMAEEHGVAAYEQLVQMQRLNTEELVE